MGVNRAEGEGKGPEKEDGLGMRGTHLCWGSLSK